MVSTGWGCMKANESRGIKTESGRVYSSNLPATHIPRPRPFRWTLTPSDSMITRPSGMSRTNRSGVASTSSSRGGLAGTVAPRTGASYVWSTAALREGS